MNTQISSKLAALVVALMLNSMIVAGVAAVFNLQFESRGASQSQTNVPRPGMNAMA